MAGLRPKLVPFCEPVPEKFFIESLGSIATDLGTAGYVIGQPGRYVVTRNLIVPDVDFGILVRANDVILDLNGRTLSSAADGPILLRVEGARGVTIRDGSLTGGGAGVVVVGPGDWYITGWVTIRNVRIEGSGPEYRGIDIIETKHVEIREVVIKGGATGIRIGDHTFNSRIVASRVEASKVGIRIDHFDGGRFHDNTVGAPDAVVIDGEGAWIHRNAIRGAPSGLAALRVLGGSNFIFGNRIKADGSTHALYAQETTVIERNDLRGGSDSTVRLWGQTSRLSDNRIIAESTGIQVSGEANLIEDNRIRGNGLLCGIMFQNPNDHVYRRNSFDATATAVCGHPNRDGGDNTYGSGEPLSPGCPPSGCGTSRAKKPSADEAGFFTRSDASDLTSSSPRHCEPGEVVLISEGNVQDTPYGKAGLFIDQPGYYLLTNDLDLEPTDIWHGVVIVGRDVVLDLGGHTILIPDSADAGIIAPGENVIVRNGVVTGGDEGFDVYGDPESSTESIRIERIGIGGRYGGITFGHVGHVELIDSSVYGHTSLYESGSALLVGNDMGTEKTALEARWIDGGILLDNRIRADYAANLGAGNRVVGNILDGSIKALGAANTFERNVFLQGRDFNIDLSDGAGRNVVGGSIIHGDVELSTLENELRGSTIIRNVFVRGERNRLENNLITGFGCGVDLQNEAGHQYKDNVVTDVREGICGSPNEDLGGNVVPPPTCGNGLRSLSEICELPYQTGDYGCEDFGFEQGTLRCNETCDGFDTAYCATCGDGIQQPLESCDALDLRGQTCESLGFAGGELTCSDQCAFDRTSCTGGCGNGVLDEGEFCEVGNLLGATCGVLGFQGGVLACNSSCTGYDLRRCVGGCGNGDVEDGEECDGEEHREGCHHSFYIGCGCSEFGMGSGRVGCNASCRFDFSTCSDPDGPPPGNNPGPPMCGDGRMEGTEQCDGNDFGARSCISEGFDGGALLCRPNCSLDLSACAGEGTCGDGVRRGNEECDQSDFGDVSCESRGFVSGQGACTADCRFDPADCNTCGNGIREGSESCDGADLGGQTCGSVGKPFGTLSCTSICTFNTSQCIGF